LLRVCVIENTCSVPRERYNQPPARTVCYRYEDNNQTTSSLDRSWQFRLAFWRHLADTPTTGPFEDIRVPALVTAPQVTKSVARAWLPNTCKRMLPAAMRTQGAEPPQLAADRAHQTSSHNFAEMHLVRHQAPWRLRMACTSDILLTAPRSVPL
jgi:hypothetical protein